MKRFIVKLLEGHSAKPEQIVDGCLGENGLVYTYLKGEASKKARMFGGKIEPYTGAYQIEDEVKFAQIPYDGLPQIVKDAFDKTDPAYIDADKSIGEKIYYVANIADEMIDEAESENLKLELLALYQMVYDYSYVVFTKA